MTSVIEGKRAAAYYAVDEYIRVHVLTFHIFFSFACFLFVALVANKAVYMQCLVDISYNTMYFSIL